MTEDQGTLAADYNDGATAARRPVRLRLTAAGLAIVLPEADAPLAVWAYEDLQLLDEAFAGAPLRLAPRGGEGRLTLREQALPPDLLAAAPQLAARRHLGQGSAGRTLLFSGLAFAGAVLALGLVLFALPHAARLAVPLVPKSWDRALGGQLSDEMAGVFAAAFPDWQPYCRAPAGQAALEALGARLAGAAEGPFDFRFTVLNVPLVNAIALPGGPIIIFKGLIEEAESSDEVAGVLAHEMSHVNRRHTMARLMETLGLGLVFGLMLGDLGGGTLAAGGQAVTSLSYSRRAESEADDGAAAILAASGIGTQGLADFFTRVTAQGAARDKARETTRETGAGGAPADAAEDAPWPAYLSSHPASPERARRFAALAVPLPPALSAADWQALRGICKVTAETPGA